MESAKNIASYIDHTILKPTASKEDVIRIASETKENGFASACIPPSFVSDVRAAFPDLTICTVIGFPLGYSDTLAKIGESLKAISDGADELDVVVNVSKIKSEEWEYVEAEMSKITDAIHDNGKIVKWIFETCYLTDEDIIRLCKICNEICADFAKTSTGFGIRGASMEDIRLMKTHLSPHVSIKASGGIRTFDVAQAYLKEGVHRLGTSSGIKIAAGI